MNEVSIENDAAWPHRAERDIVERLVPWAGSFGYNTLRQVRYLLAIVAAVLVFNWVGSNVLSSPWTNGSVIAAWGPAGSLGAELAMLAALAIAIFLGMFITWPDTPHSGLLTAAVGLGVLALRWGPINLLLAQNSADLSRVYHLMMLQCLFWLVFVLAGEAISRLAYRIIFHNRLWIQLAGFDGLPMPEAPGTGVLMPLSGSAVQSDQVRQYSLLKTLLIQAGGLIITGVVGVVLLEFLMRSQFVGQVLFAAFAAFGVGAFVAGLVFPDITPWAIWPAIPATAAGIYFVGIHFGSHYPGQAGLQIAGALPVDYVCAGLSGAILGYYTVVRMHVRRRWEESVSNA